NVYDNLIVQFEHVFYGNFKNSLKNFGYNSNVTHSLFKVVGQYYDFTNHHDKRMVLDSRKSETFRVFNEQFRIREFEENRKIEIDGEDKKLLVDRLEAELGIIKDVSIKIFKSTLPYFNNTSAYHLYYSDNTIKYILGNEDFVSYLDYTNAPIYGMAHKNGFILSSDHAADYVSFFFD